MRSGVRLHRFADDGEDRLVAAQRRGGGEGGAQAGIRRKGGKLRGQGIGGWLIPYLANELAGEGWTVTFLCAAERCRFYERLGFVLQKQYVKYKL